MAIIHVKDAIDRPLPGYLAYEEVQECIEVLYIRMGLIKTIVMYAANRMRKLGFSPAAFSLDDTNCIDDYRYLKDGDFWCGYMGFTSSSDEKTYMFYVSYDGEEDDDAYDFSWIMFCRDTSETRVYDNVEGKWVTCPDVWMSSPEDADFRYQNFI